MNWKDLEIRPSNSFPFISLHLCSFQFRLALLHKSSKNLLAFHTIHGDSSHQTRGSSTDLSWITVFLFPVSTGMVKSMSHMPHLFSKWLFSQLLPLEWATWIGQVFSKSSRSDFFLLSSSFFNIFLSCILEATRGKQATSSILCLEISSLKYPASLLTKSIFCSTEHNLSKSSVIMQQGSPFLQFPIRCSSFLSEASVMD